MREDVRALRDRPMIDIWSTHLDAELSVEAGLDVLSHVAIVGALAGAERAARVGHAHLLVPHTHTSHRHTQNKDTHKPKTHTNNHTAKQTQTGTSSHTERKTRTNKHIHTKLTLAS